VIGTTRHSVAQLVVGALLCIGACSWWTAQALPNTPPNSARYVVLISIDGLRPDAITELVAPNIHKLRSMAARARLATTIRPSMTLPAHVSMLTGLDYPRHGVSFNQYVSGHIQHATVFDVVKAAGKKSAAFVAKNKLSFLLTSEVIDYIYRGPGLLEALDSTTAADVLNAFVDNWPVNEFAFTFVHIKEPDTAGHAHQWMSEQYLKGVRIADDAMGTIVDTIESSGRMDSSIIMITADHGGKGYTHEHEVEESMRIPWLVYGPGIEPKTIDRTVHLYDTAPTALQLLGLGFKGEVDGSPICEIWSKLATSGASEHKLYCGLGDARK